MDVAADAGDGGHADARAAAGFYHPSGEGRRQAQPRQPDDVPVLSIRDRGSLSLHGADFGVAQGSLAILDKASGEFRTVNGGAASQPGSIRGGAHSA